MKPLFALLLAAGVATTAQAGCRRGGVEWIVGGTAPVDCDQPTAERGAEVRPRAATASTISTASQRQRDQERRLILVQELAQEEQRLPRSADADSALRTRDNIAALKRELARLNVAQR
ncbi:hypothetical protein ACG02S_01755 [Roseateles sp. DC23W]|uniref:DUF4124 domain-containing protein n=1 Tax=Pelomonas dachongensis TaxID=3299029 RepID=A0ABW7EGN6_9BURK